LRDAKLRLLIIFCGDCPDFAGLASSVGAAGGLSAVSAQAGRPFSRIAPHSGAAAEKAGERTWIRFSGLASG